jgi:FtsP/CotA-like multicopper oxidase with cupredoxin domain
VLRYPRHDGATFQNSELEALEELEEGRTTTKGGQEGDKWEGLPCSASHIGLHISIYCLPHVAPTGRQRFSDALHSFKILYFDIQSYQIARPFARARSMPVYGWLVSTCLLVSLCQSIPYHDPEERVSDNGMLETTFSVQASEFKGHGISFTTRTYEGQVPGPTLRLRPGDTLVLNLKNDLGKDNLLHANTTNLHPHGMHVSPLEDNVFVNVTPGDAHKYVIHVPQDHPTGTFWYHPHRLPGDLIQQLGGMSGAIVVEDREKLPPALAAMKQHVMVLQKWLWCRNNTDPCGWNSLGHVVHSDDYYFPALTKKYNSSFPLAAQPADWSDVEYLSINGLYKPTLPITAGERRYIRLVNSATDMQLKVSTH